MNQSQNKCEVNLILISNSVAYRAYEQFLEPHFQAAKDLHASRAGGGVQVQALVSATQADHVRDGGAQPLQHTAEGL